jgi:hypothetical protein
VEAGCCIIFDMPSQDLRDKAAEFLAEDSRPVFEDEVAPEYRTLFNALEYTEYADDLRIAADKSIHAYFLMGGDFDDDVRYFFDCLHKAGAEIAVAAIEADEFEGLIYMGADGKIKTLGNAYRKLMKFTDLSNDEPTEEGEEIDDDLADMYARLELVKRKLMAD